MLSRSKSVTQPYATVQVDPTGTTGSEISQTNNPYFVSMDKVKNQDTLVYSVRSQNSGFPGGKQGRQCPRGAGSVLPPDPSTGYLRCSLRENSSPRSY